MIIRKFLMLNGPPRCGKDTASQILLRHAELRGYGIIQEKLANPLRHIAFAMANSTHDDFSYDDFKNREHQPFFVSGRQLMIDASERFMKPVYGKNIFSSLLLERVQRVSPLAVIVVSDSGFQHEVDYLHGLGHDIVVANIHRQGCTFEGDSREWVRSPIMNRESFQVDNSGDMNHLNAEVFKLWRYARKEFQI